MERIFSIMPWFLPLLGCDDGVAPEDTDTDHAAAECPDGLDRTTDANLIFFELRLDGIDYFTGFDADATYDGEAAACVDAAGTHAVLTFEVGDEPFGSFELAFDEPGSSALSNSTDHIAFDLFGSADSLLVDNGEDWQTGTVNVSTIGSPIALDLTGTASTGGHNLSVSLSAEATPN